ncbi:MAG TPA: hypothetical protein VFF47_00395 [Nitrospirota bacterium]|nr:hypothetical protein [Nitrospirota bacterium]
MFSVLVFVTMLEGISNIRTKFTLLLLSAGFLAISIISGCAGKVILSDDAVRIRNTVDMIYQMKDLYEQHDDGLLSLFSADYLSESGMNVAVSQDMKRFNVISLNIFIDRIEVDKDLINVSVHWSGSWDNGEKISRDGGSSVIIIRSGDDLKVVDIKGDSPFGKSNK